MKQYSYDLLHFYEKVYTIEPVDKKLIIYKHLMIVFFEMLAVLREKRVLHRDVKFENILVNADGDVVLTDYTMSTFYNKKNTATAGTLYTMSPEVLGDGVYDYSCDVWSFGVLLHTLAYGNFLSRQMPPGRHSLENVKANLTSSAAIKTSAPPRGFDNYTAVADRMNIKNRQNRLFNGFSADEIRAYGEQVFPNYSDATSSAVSPLINYIK